MLLSTFAYTHTNTCRDALTDTEKDTGCVWQRHRDSLGRHTRSFAARSVGCEARGRRDDDVQRKVAAATTKTTATAVAITTTTVLTTTATATAAAAATGISLKFLNGHEIDDNRQH